MIRSSYQVFPLGRRTLWWAGAAARSSMEEVARRMTQTDSPAPRTGSTWKPRNQNMIPKEIKETIAQPTPFDSQLGEFARGASTPGGGEKDVAAKSRPTRVRKRPTAFRARMCS